MSGTAMPKADLTIEDLDALPAPEARNYHVVWDKEIAGYGVRITLTGIRSFVAQGRVNGKPVLYTIGRINLYEEAEARELARTALQQMRDGIDPREMRPNTGRTPSEQSENVTAARLAQEVRELRTTNARLTKENDELRALVQIIERDRDEMLAYIEQER